MNADCDWPDVLLSAHIYPFMDGEIKALSDFAKIPELNPNLESKIFLCV